MATQLFQAAPPYGSPAWLHHMIAEAASATEPKMAVVDIGPPLAKALLDANFDNRSIRNVKVAQYSADMKAGRWTLNGEPLIVAKDGKLNDGQHRCLAVIDANASIPGMIVFGVERVTRLTVDQGGARSAGDFLGMDGVQNAAMAAAIGRMVIAFERVNGVGLANAHQVTSAEVRERVMADARIGDAATFGHTNSQYTRQFAPGSLIGFAHYVLCRIHHDEAVDFLQRVCRGDGLAIGTPMHTLREKLLASGRMPRDRKAALILKAWNFHRRKVKRLALNSLNTELPFPALI